MGKKQHQKDKLYLTCSEWSTLYGGKKTSGPESSKRADFKRLPFHCCSLSFQPFQHPYCTGNGVVYDLSNIVPFLKTFGVDPVSGEKTSMKDLIKLHFYKNAKDQFHCPVTFKVFNENTHIVAVKPTGNVYAYEAVERLNIKANYWKDLTNDQPFTRKDIIHLQDPTNLDKFNLAKFYHIKKNIKVLDEEEELAKKNPRYKLNAVTKEAESILNELDSTYKAAEDKSGASEKHADSINAAYYSTGKMAASFTSTAFERVTEQEAAIVDEDLLRYERVKKKAYIRLVTSKGPLNIELHSDMVPKTCENFLKHCMSGYYNGTVFHRSIKNFMIQGGDPTGTGTGGESIWGKPFKDEIKPNLTHTGRGVLSMANSGPDTNKSQFFITYRSARHLDGKHSVFGRVVGGLDTIDKMERVETDKKTDKPLKEMKIISAQVFVNPYEEADEQLKREREESLAAKAAESSKATKRSADSDERKVFRSGVGKYLSNSSLSTSTSEEPSVKKKKKEAKSSLTDFSAW